MTPQYKDFLSKELPAKLRTLSGDQAPNFGLMTAQHMVEHLIFTTKSIAKRRSEPEAELNKSQQYFRKFIDAGAPFEHRPKEGAELKEFRSPNIEEAIQGLEKAIEQFYALFDSNPDHKSYNPMTGEFNLAELELFNYQHGRYHLYQFGLIEEFTAIKL